VEERIPPRMKVRRGAALELSHVIMLCDDAQQSIIEPLQAKREQLEKIYDTELMQGGGNIKGWLVSGDNATELEANIARYCENKAAEYGDVAPMLFAVGDGNHSLATAKACYEELKANNAHAEALARARYAMVELENIRDSAQAFEPIHRLLSAVDSKALLAFLESSCCAAGGYPVRWMSGGESGTIYLDREKGLLPVGILQPTLDSFLAESAAEIDYIHGIDALSELSAKPGSIGFELPPVPKGDFFRGIAKDGVLPRKTFSMGEAQEKRYYLEGRAL